MAKRKTKTDTNAAKERTIRARLLDVLCGAGVDPADLAAFDGDICQTAGAVAMVNIVQGIRRAFGLPDEVCRIWLIDEFQSLDTLAAFIARNVPPPIGYGDAKT